MQCAASASGIQRAWEAPTGGGGDDAAAFADLFAARRGMAHSGWHCCCASNRCNVPLCRVCLSVSARRASRARTQRVGTGRDGVETAQRSTSRWHKQLDGVTINCFCARVCPCCHSSRCCSSGACVHCARSGPVTASHAGVAVPGHESGEDENWSSMSARCTSVPLALSGAASPLCSLRSPRLPSFFFCCLPRRKLDLSGHCGFDPHPVLQRKAEARTSTETD
jgi:hypothetical protein